MRRGAAASSAAIFLSILFSAIIDVGAAPVCSAGGFCWEHPAPQGNAIFAAWGASPDDVWLVGAAGTILHLDGRERGRDGGDGWSPVASGTTANLFAVWGSAKDDIWAAGENGIILHFDGKAWSAMSSPARRTIRALWGSAKDSVWAVGDRGMILRWDGRAWSEEESFVRLNLLAIGGGGADDVWAAGATGTTLHRAGGRWTPIKSPTVHALREIWYAAPNEVWAVAFVGPSLRWDGAAWQAVPRPPEKRYAMLAAWRAPDGAALAIDRCGAVYRRNGNQWMESGGAPAELRIVSTDPVSGERVGLPISILNMKPRADCDATRDAPPILRGIFIDNKGTSWAAGMGGAVFRNDEKGAWSRMEVPAQADFETIWASGPDDVWVGGGDTVLRRKGANFTPAGDGLDAPISAISGSAPDDVWAAGERGMIARFGGARWASVRSGTTLPLRALWMSARGRGFAVGGRDASGGGAARGVVLRWDGRRWSSAASTKAALRSVHGAGDQAWAVGESGVVLRFDGRRWKNIDIGTREDLNGVWAGAANDVWVVGRRGTIVHFDGRTWKPEPRMTDNHLLSVTGDAHSVRIAGVNGTILVRPRGGAAAR